MSKKRYDLTRRKVLGSLGVIGAGAALGGAGTMAFFSDEEQFEGNQLVAGTLDLKVDWQEHYSDWSDDESAGIGTVQMSPGAGLTGFPSTAPENEKSVWVSDPAQFMDNTAVEAYPDPDDDNIQDDFASEPNTYTEKGVGYFCEDGADTSEDLDPKGRTGTGLRTLNEWDAPRGEATVDENGDPLPLVYIDDVKPGDFGEVTFSFHLCDNPGYVWLTGALRDDLTSENGYTEPELNDPDESGDQDGDGKDDEVELLKEMRAAFWYDTGSNSVYDGEKIDGEGDNIFGTGEVFLPMSGTLGSVLTALENRMFLLDPEPVTDSHSGGSGSNGSSPSVGPGDGSNLADEVIVTATDPRFGGAARNYQCADYENRLDVGDIVGSEILNPETAPIVSGRSYAGCTTITVDALDDSTGTITLSSTGPVKIVSVKGGNEGENVYVFDTPVVLDEVTFTTPTDSNISNVDVCCPVNGNGGNGDNGDRKCFPNSTTAYVGFEWWLPVDHANEIQTDSVGFDLGFYTEQCRHNDGSGMPPERLVTLTGDSPQGQGEGFAHAWDTSDSLAHRGSGSWGTVDYSQNHNSYKQGFYFGGEFSDFGVLPEFTVSEIEEVSYWLYKDTDLDGVDIYLNIYTQPEGDGDDAASWYDSRLQALPSAANQGSPNFTPGQWNEFSTASSASNTLTWSDSGRGGNFVQSLPTLDEVQGGSIDWSTYGANLTMSHDYSSEKVRALSLQTGSQSGVSLEAYIDDVTVKLTNGAELVLDLEP